MGPMTSTLDKILRIMESIEGLLFEGIFIRLIFIFISVYVFVCKCMCHLCVSTHGVQKRALILRNWSYRWL